MGISDFFLKDLLPDQYIYEGESHWMVFRRHKRESFQIAGQAPGGLADLGSGNGMTSLKKALANGAAGLILGPAHFIFNILEFDRLPWQGKLRRELVDWRLEKIFPEDISGYEHRSFTLDQRRILSLLVRKQPLREREQRLREQGIPLTYIGSSTVEIINQLFRPRIRPDYFIEIDGSVTVLVFQNASRPIYIRKFKADSAADTAGEIVKTFQFVSTNQRLQFRSYALINHQGNVRLEAKIEAELTELQLSRQPTADQKFPFIPAGR